MATHKNLAEAKLAVMTEVGYVQKTSSKGLTYTFASEQDMIMAIRPAMIAHGMLMRPLEVEILSDESYTSKTGSQMKRVVIRRSFEFSHVSSGEKEVVHVLGEASDSGDKACGKAATHAKKYAIREYFILETGDDPDFLAEERDADNYSAVLRYHASLSQAKGKEDLNNRMSQVEKAAKDGKLTPKQLEGLRQTYMELRGE